MDRILVVDDDLHTLKMVKQLLSLKKYNVTCCLTYKDATREMGSGKFSVAVLDYFMPDTTGLEMMKKFREMDPDLPVIILTASREINIAVETIREGAYNYLVKPMDPDELYINIENALKSHRLQIENRDLKTSLKDKYKFKHIIGGSGRMQEVFDLTSRSARVRSNVLITGETGVGKELIARAIHYNSDRSGGPFLKVNCSALAESMLEAELFGIDKNVATGVDARAGKFEAADGGTLFLDEIGDMVANTQAKVLRAMQEREIERVGSNATRKVDIRILAATNLDLEKAIEEKEFRQDLYFRLNVLVIPLPPLRDRRPDISDLVDHFLQKVCSENNMKLKTLSREAMECFMVYDWPGNVRELENTVERSVIMCDEDEVQSSHLPAHIGGQPVQFHGESGAQFTFTDNGGSLDDKMGDFEMGLILSALEDANWRQNKAADTLGISARSMWYKIKKLGISIPNKKG